jgi:hypothetical protein
MIMMALLLWSLLASTSLAQSPTVTPTAAEGECCVTISQPLTKDDARRLRTVVDDAGYTRFNLVTQNGYRLTINDFVLLFRPYTVTASGNNPDSQSNNTTGNVRDQEPSVIPMYTCTALNLKEADLADECFSSVSHQTDYGIYIGHLMNLRDLTTSKTALGPDLRYTNVSNTLVAMKIPKLADGVDASKATATVGLFTGFKALTLIDLNTAAKGDIPERAFSGCTSLQEVKISTTGLKTIGAAAFQGCTNLHVVSFPSGVTEIGNQAFADCDLTQLTLPNTLQHIASLAFMNNRNLKVVKIPATVSQIDNQAFIGNTSLTDVYLLGDNIKSAATGFATDLTCSGFSFSNNYLTAAGTCGTMTCAEWTKYSGATNGPAVLHIPNTATARARYLNPCIRLINDAEAMGELRTIYATYGKTDGNMLNMQRTAWEEKWSDVYPGATIDAMKWSIYNFMQAHYVDAERKVTVTTDSGPVSVNYCTTICPWVTDDQGVCYPRQDPSNLFSNPIISNANQDYAGWNQFLLAVTDADSNTDTVELPTFTDDRWYSMCLPFSMTRAQIDEAFGGKTEICEFNKVEKDAKSNITFYFTEEVGTDASGNCTKAHHPYMIRPELKSTVMPTSSPVQRVIYDVSLYDAATQYPGTASDSANMVKVPFIDRSDPSHVVVYDDAYTFVGNEILGQVIPGDSYFWAWNASQQIGSFFHASSQLAEQISWPQYTAIVRPRQTDYASGAKGNLTMLDWYDTDAENTTTRIEIIKVAGQAPLSDGKVYTLHGQYVGDDSSLLAPGVYIMNGKKVLVK